jgi:glycolate oxidase FAD binding subunit
MARKLGFDFPLTVLRLEGIAPSVDARFDRLAGLLSEYGKVERLEGATSMNLWRAIRDVEPLAEPNDKIIWKLSVTPTSAPHVLADIRESVAAEALFDWSGGLLWLALEPSFDATAALVRGAVARNGGGHATLIRAPDQCRKEICVFEPQPEPLAQLTKRLKAQFDPSGILEPDRMTLETRNAN